MYIAIDTVGTPHTCHSSVYLYICVSESYGSGLFGRALDADKVLSFIAFGEEAKDSVREFV